MSRRCIGYADEGKKRRPVYADEGPSSAATTDPIARHANGGHPSLGGPVGGAGPVERRKATTEELAAAKAREAKPRHLVLATLAKPGPTAGSMDPVLALEQRTADEPSPAIEEETAVAEAAQDMSTEVPIEPPVLHVETIGDSLSVLADAVVEAIEANDELVSSERLFDQARVRWQQARAALDAAYRALDDPPVRVESRVESRADYADDIPDPIRRINHAAAVALAVDELVTEIPADGPLPGTQAARDAIVERIRSEGRSTKKAPLISPTEERVLAAIAHHRGDQRAAAAELGMKTYQQVNTALHRIGRKGLLPTEVITFLPAGFAKYSSVPA
jgi:hypothetical protein